MPTPEETIRLYAQLAEEHHQRDRPQERDRFLLLAADAALAAGKRDVAENFRRTLLARNPNHLLKPYATLAEALGTPDIASYVQELRRTYPPDKLQRGTRLPGAANGRESDDEEFILPLDLERATKHKPSFAFTQEPEAPKPMRTGDRAMPNPIDPFKPKPLPPQPVWQPPQPLPATASNTGPGVFSLRPEPLPRRAAAPAPSRGVRPDEAPSGSWMGAFLFLVILIAGLALFAWVFVRPFLPVA